MLKPLLGCSKTVWCQSSGTCCLNVVGDIMEDRAVWGVDLSEGGEFQQEGVVGIVRVPWPDSWAGRGISRDNALNVQVSGCIVQLMLSHVNQ